MLGEDRRCSVGQCGFGMDERVELVDVGPDRCCCIGCSYVCLGDDHRDCIADEAHPLGGERRPDEVVVHRSDAMMRSHTEVGGRIHRNDTGHLDGVLDVHLADNAVGDLGAGEHGMQRPGKVEVGYVARCSGE